MVFDSAHEPIGTVDEIVYDEATTRPLWVGVTGDSSGDRRMLVPLEGAAIGDGGLVLPYTEELVHRAPPVDGDIGRRQEHELRAHYGLTARTSSGGTRTLT